MIGASQRFGWRQGWRCAALLAAVIASGAYLVLLIWIHYCQERLIFRPEPLPVAHRFVLDDVHEVSIDVGGETLSALHLKLPNPQGVVFFLHGNTGNLSTWFIHSDFYRAANYDLFMLDYRGYGKSSGRIASEEQLHGDVSAVWQQVAPRYAGKRIVFYGRSLGTGLAARLAVQSPPDLTMLVSPYESMVALARTHYPWVPGALLRYPLRTDEHIGRIRGPLVLLHGELDTLIPPAHSEALRTRAPQARLVLVPGGGHNDLQQFDSYLQAVSAALRAL